MLILRRKVKEKLVVIVEGKSFTIEVIDLKSGIVRLGILAPDDVQVYRPEALAKALACQNAECEPVGVG